MNLLVKTLLLLMINFGGSLAYPNELIKLTKDNSVILSGRIDNNSAHLFLQELFEKLKTRKSVELPFYIIIDSPGGSIIAQERIVDTVKDVHNVKILITFAASAAAYLVEFLPFERLVYQNAKFMLHYPYFLMSGKITYEELISLVTIETKYRQNLLNALSARTKLSTKFIKEQMKSDWWITPVDLIRFNLADKIVDITCTNKVENDEQQKIDNCNKLFSKGE